MMVAIVGEAGLAPADRRALAFAEAFERDLVGQGTQRRTLAETIERGWRLLDGVPREDLLKLSDAMIDRAQATARRRRTPAGRGGHAMTTATRSAATRSNLVRLRRRLDQVEKGAALLRKKRESLAAELFELARPAVDVRRGSTSRRRIAYRALLEALAWLGRTELRALGWPTREIRVELVPREVWGIRGDRPGVQAIGRAERGCARQPIRPGRRSAGSRGRAVREAHRTPARSRSRRALPSPTRRGPEPCDAAREHARAASGRVDGSRARRDARDAGRA